MKRTGKFYRKNESEVMKSLGLKPTKNSGSGWIEKEDGQNDYVACQLKSTDSQSIRVQQKDLHTLVYNSSVAHKLPVFAIQFLNDNELWLMCKPEDLSEISKYIETGKCVIPESVFEDEVEIKPRVERKVIKGSKSSRNKFHENISEMYKKEKSSI